MSSDYKGFQNCIGILNYIREIEEEGREGRDIVPVISVGGLVNGNSNGERKSLEILFHTAVGSLSEGDRKCKCRMKTTELIEKN